MGKVGLPYGKGREKEEVTEKVALNCPEMGSLVESELLKKGQL